MAKKKKKRKFSPEDKVAIIKEHHIDKLVVSEVCDKHDLNPNQFYTWQKQFFENGAEAFRPKMDDLTTRRLKKKVDKLEKKLAEKDEVIAEISEEYVEDGRLGRWEIPPSRACTPLRRELRSRPPHGLNKRA